jgi:hypothetical protein
MVILMIMLLLLYGDYGEVNFIVDVICCSVVHCVTCLFCSRIVVTVDVVDC